MGVWLARALQVASGTFAFVIVKPRLPHSKMLTAHIIVFLASISFISCQQNPTISFISKEKVVEIGDTLTLICIVQFARDYPVHWIKANVNNSNNYLFISRGSTVNIPNSRYSVKVESSQYDSQSSQSTYNLIIDKVQETDTGRYSCQIITGTASKNTAEVDLFVRIPPIIR